MLLTLNIVVCEVWCSHWKTIKYLLYWKKKCFFKGQPHHPFCVFLIFSSNEFSFVSIISETLLIPPLSHLEVPHPLHHNGRPGHLSPQQTSGENCRAIQSTGHESGRAATAKYRVEELESEHQCDSAAHCHNWHGALVQWWVGMTNKIHKINSIKMKKINRE